MNYEEYSTWSTTTTSMQTLVDEAAKTAESMEKFKQRLGLLQDAVKKRKKFPPYTKQYDNDEEFSWLPIDRISPEEEEESWL